ncbi:MAG: hypothetical protein RI955_509 [Bacteroidota bacterium]|jgi:hypothetical protein
MKKITLTVLSIICCIALAVAQPQKVRCGIEAPSQEWDNWFNQKVEEYKLEQQQGRSKATTTYVIPVVFHIIYGNQNIGSFPNLSNAQVLSQIKIINDDFKGIGYNSTVYATMGSGGHLPFYNYAVANSLPAPDNNGVAIGSLDIQFKPAFVKPNGDTLAIAGIDRISYSANGWANPTSFTTKTSFTTYMDGTVKPATIWDPTKYLNVWVSDCNQSVSILGYSTFPAASTLTGLSAPYGNSNTDGTWIWAQSCGDVGTLASGYDKGRTLTHELGHYFGLRHTWGDSNCGNDYCNDIPPTKTANYNSWPIAYPFNASTCTNAGAYKSNATDGEMFMNFMDYCADEALWMFTNDQVIRMNTALINTPNRNNLTASALLVCKPDVGASADNMAKQYLNAVVNIFPNPSNGKFTITTNFATASTIKLQVRNVMGQLVLATEEKNITKAAFTYDISHIAKGIYIVTIADANGITINKKLIIE